MSAASQLLQALYGRLKSESAFAELLGDGVVAERLMERGRLPAVIFAEVDSRDNSTASEGGEVHFISIDIWSDGTSRMQAQKLAAFTRQLLVDAALDLGPDHHLVGFYFLDEKTGRDKGKAEHSIRLRFRAVSEPVVSNDEIDP